MADAAIVSAALHDMRFPGEGARYRDARNELLRAEIELRRQVERVAELRRALPPGGEVPQDYVFEGEDGPVKLSELFGDKDTLVAYSYMYGPKMERPCPSCTSMLDSLDGQAPHIGRQVSLAVIARSPLERIKAFTVPRGWQHLRLLSSAANSYHADYHGEAPDGSQWPVMNIFSRRDGRIRHFWASEMMFAPSDPGQDPRHIDMIWPLWNVLDMTPEGRQGFYPKLGYD
jgi:predicted dithiol-disulfide oxidoreductase (DUF899 family)